MANFSITGGTFSLSAFTLSGLTATDPVLNSPKSMTWSGSGATVDFLGKGLSLGPDGAGGVTVASGQITGMTITMGTEVVTISGLNVAAKQIAHDIDTGHWATLYKHLTAASAEIIGADGRDTITGGPVGDVIYGMAGADKINGGGGDDTIIGGTGHDVLTGGAGADQFYFVDKVLAANADTITDFSAGADRLEFESGRFAALGMAGQVDAAAFVTGTAATTAAQHLVYDNTSGRLYYDADGVGGAAQVLVATLTGHPALSALDCWVF